MPLLSDEEVFGTAAPGGLLSDEDVFGAFLPKAAPPARSTRAGIADYLNAANTALATGVVNIGASAGTVLQDPGGAIVSGALGARAGLDRGMTALINAFDPEDPAVPHTATQRAAQVAAEVAADRRAANAAEPWNVPARMGKFMEEDSRRVAAELQAQERSENPALVAQQEEMTKAQGFTGNLKAAVQNPLATFHTLARSAPDMALGVGMGATVARAGGGIGAVSAAGTASEAASSGMQAREGTYQQVAGMPLEQLANSPRFQEIAQAAGDPVRAREILANELADQTPLLSAAGTAAGTLLTNRLFGGDATAKTIMGGERMTARELGRRVAQDTVEEGVQGVPEDTVQHGAVVQADPSKEWDPGGSLAQNMVAGFAMGAGGHGQRYVRDVASGIRAAKPDAVPAATATPPTAPAASPAAAPATPAAPAAPSGAQVATADGTEAEKALRTPVTLTALDRAAEIDSESASIRERLAEISTGNGYGPAFDQERQDLATKAAMLAQERADIASTWPAAVKGAPTAFSTESGARLEGEYALMDAGDLVTSHDEGLRPNPLFPQELQPRDRSRSASELQVSGIVQKLDPARLGVSADAATGAPIVGADGLVESGNARTIAMKRVYQANGQKAEDYKSWLRDNAAQFGLAPEAVEGMAKPVLVRVRTTPVNRAEFARQANASTVQRMSPSEQALSDARRLATLDGLDPDEDGNFSGSHDFIRQFMATLPITEQSDLIESDGRLSTAGYRRVQNAVLAKAYGDSPSLRRMTESMDNNLVNVSKALLRVAPTIAAARERMQAGTLHQADIATDLLAAVEGLSALKEKGWTAAQELAQTDLTGPRYSPEASELLTFLDANIRAPRRIAEFVQRYYEALEQAGDPSQPSMFGDDAGAPARNDLITKAKGAPNGNTAENPERGVNREGAQPAAQVQRESQDAPGNRGGDQGDGPAGATAGGGQPRAQQGEAANDAASEWVTFPADSGTLGIPRRDMPQIKGEHRGALVNFLAARGVDATHDEVPADSLKPTQAEFSRAKVERFMKTGPVGERSVLVSSDGHVLDGHHQWMATQALGQAIPVIRLGAPIRELLDLVAQFPSVQQSEGATADPRAAAVQDFKDALADLAQIATKHTRAAMLPENTPGLMPTLVKLFDAAIRLVGTDVKATTAWVKGQLKQDARTKALWNKINSETYRKAALQALEGMDQPAQRGLFDSHEAAEEAIQGDLFAQPAAEAEKPTPEGVVLDLDGVVIRQGKGLIKGKFLAEVDGQGVPNTDKHKGPFNTEQEAYAAAIDWRETLASRAAEAKNAQAQRDQLAEKLKAGEPPSDADLRLVDLRPGTSDVRWFFSRAADLFGLTSRQIRPLVADLIRIRRSDMGTAYEYVPTSKALMAIAASVSNAAPKVAMINGRAYDMGRDNFKPPKVAAFMPADALAAADKVLGENPPRGADALALSAADRARAEALLAPVLAKAAEAKPDYDQKIIDIAQEVGALGQLLAPLKGLKRGAEKLAEEGFDIGGMKDLLRSTIVVRSYDDAQAVMDAIEREFKLLRTPKNRTGDAPLRAQGKDVPAEDPAKYAGYSDIMVNVALPNGTIAEIQINTPEMLAAKGEHGHALYEVLRAEPKGSERAAAVNAASVEFYNVAREAARKSPSEIFDQRNGHQPVGSMPFQGDFSSSTNRLPSGNSTYISSTPSSSVISMPNTQPSGNLSGTLTKDPFASIVGAAANSDQTPAGDQTQTEAFKRWFGNSKVVDAEGRPLVVYHGTVADFDAFDNAKTGANDRGLWGRGHYFSASVDNANSYALRQGEGARLIPAYVSIKNPLILKTGGDLVTRLPDGTNTRELVGPNLDGAKIKQIALDGGHDGVIQIRPNGLIGDLVAYSPEQIKSATGNNGQFDPTKADIRLSRSPDTKANYEARIDALFAGETTKLQGARVLDRSDMLSFLGLGDGPVNLAEGKVLASQDNHPHMTAAVWKKIPEWLENPALVFDSDTAPGRLVFIAPEMVNGSPVRIVVGPNATGGGVSAHLLVNAYDAQSNPFRRWESEGLLRYVDRNKYAHVSGTFQPRLAGLPGDRGRKGILTDKQFNGWRRANSPESRLSFAGASAATADMHALVTAQDRLDRGEDAETVRRETGWHRGVDGRMRFEISDANASYIGKDALERAAEEDPYGSAELPLGDVLNHPALFAAYPALRDITVFYESSGKAQGKLYHGANFNARDNVITLGNGLSEDKQLSALLHELQHGIQSIEGFATGGSRQTHGEVVAALKLQRDLWADVYSVRRELDAGKTIDEVRSEWMEALGSEPQLEAVRIAQDQSLGTQVARENLAKLEDQFARLRAQDPGTTYHRLAGEVEARNTQTRRKFSEAARRGTPPRATADVADADVIVSFNGKEMANAPKPANASVEAARSGLRLSELASIADRVRSTMPNMPTVHTLASPVDAPAALQDYIREQGAWNDVEGALHQGELYLFSSGLRDPVHAEFVLAQHEAAHFGLRALLGPKLPLAMRTVFNNNPAIQRAVADLQRRGKLSDIEATEEVLVDMPSERLAQLRGWRRVVSAIQDWLASNGFDAIAQRLQGWLDGTLSEQQLADLMAADLVRTARDYVAGKVDGNPREAKGLTRLYDQIGKDLAVQEKWLTREARARGYKSVDDLLERNYSLFEKLGALWKITHAEAMPVFSRGSEVQPGSPRLSRGGNSTPPPGAGLLPNRWQQLKRRVNELISADNVDKILYEFQDKLIDLKRLRDHIAAIGGTINDLNDAYQGEELYHKRVAKRTEDFLAQELKPLLAEMRVRGITLAQFEQYLHARHAPEANKELSFRNPNQQMIDAGKAAADAQIKQLELDLQRAHAAGSAVAPIEKALDQAMRERDRWNGAQAFKGTEEERLSLSGMSDADAAGIMAALSPRRASHMEALAARVDAINAKTLDTLQSYGLMDAQTLQAWRSTYQHYVPLHRDEAHPDSVSHPIGQGYSVKGDAGKRRAGSNAKVTHILGHIAMQREAALTRGEKNMVGQKLYLMAAQNPDPDWWQVDRPPKTRTVDSSTGLVVERVDPLYKNRPNVIMVRIAGADAAIVFNERNERAARLAGALKNLDASDLGAVTTLVAKGTRWFASVNTQYNPVFGIINFARDVQGAVLNLGTTPLKGKELQVAQSMWPALKAIYAHQRAARAGAVPGQVGGAWGKLWDEMQNAGGTTGYRDLYADPKDRAESLEKAMAALERGKTSQFAHGVLDWLSDYNETMEGATRLAAYKVALDMGMSRPRAASLAKNLTVNFNRKGEKARSIGAYYAFFNAAVQGTTRMMETLRGPTGKKVMLGGVMLGAMNAMIGMAMMGGDDGEENGWMKIPEFVRERSLVIPLGREDFVAIPLPLGFNVLPNLGRKAVEAMSGLSKKSTGAQLGEMLGMVVNAFNPFGAPSQLDGSQLTLMVSPTVFDPGISLLANRDWTGKPIYRENSSSLDPEPGHRRAKDSASTPSKFASLWLNKLSGGTDYRPGAISLTPDQIDYVIGQLTGGVGRELMKVNQMVAAPFTGDELPAHKIPLLGRLYGNVRGPSAESGDYYDNVRELNELENELKGRAQDGGDVEALRKQEPLLSLIGRGAAAERQIQLLRKQRNAASKDGDAARVKEINERIGEVMKDLNREVAVARSAKTR